MIYQNHNHTPWAFLAFIVICAFVLLGVLIKDKFDEPATQIPVSGLVDSQGLGGGGSTGSPIGAGTDPTLKLQNAPTPTKTQPAPTPDFSFATRTAMAHNYEVTATSQALAFRATEVSLGMTQTQAAQKSTEQADRVHATQAAQDIENQERARGQMVTQTAEAERHATETKQAAAQEAGSWIDLGVKVFTAAAVIALGAGIFSWLQASAYAKKQAADAKYLSERRRLLEVQGAIRNRQYDGGKK